MSREARIHLRHALAMDDCKAHRILALTDNELYKVCVSNYGADWVKSILRKFK